MWGFPGWYEPCKSVSGYGAAQLLTLTIVQRILLIVVLYLFEKMILWWMLVSEPDQGRV